MSCFTLTGFSDEISDSFREQLHHMEAFGIDHIEIRGVDGDNIVNYSTDQVRLYKEQLDASGIKVSAIGSPIGKVKLADDFEAHYELFKHTVEAALILETKYIRLFSFYLHDNNDKDEEALVLKRMKIMVNYAESKGITLLHENEKDIYGDIPSRCLTLYEEMNSDNFKLIFDPANYIQCQVTPYPDAYNLLKDYTVYYHIKDAKKEDGTVVPAGAGDGSIDLMIKDLQERDFSGFLSLEPHLGYFEGYNALETEDSQMEFDSNSGPGKFEIATKALRKILGEVTAHE